MLVSSPYLQKNHFIPMPAHLWIASLLVLLPQFFAAIAADYPTRSVRFIVPFAAGGIGDIMARVIGQRLSENMGQSFVVDNRPGANSIIGPIWR